MLWMDENVSQQSNEKSLVKENLQLLFDSTTKQARTAPTWGIEAGTLTQQVKYVGNTDVFCFFLFYKSKMDQN